MNILRVLLFTGLCLLCGLSFAEGTVTATPGSWSYTSTHASGSGFGSASSMCADAASKETANYWGPFGTTVTVNATNVTGATVVCVLHRSDGPNFNVNGAQGAGSCPAHSTGTATCTCSAGYHPDATGASCIPSCVAGQSIATGWYDVGTAITISSPQLYCSGPCEYVSTGATDVQPVILGGQKKWMARMGYTSTGNDCGGAPSVPSPSGGASSPPAPTCAPGQYGGTINGVFSCIDPVSGKPTASIPAPGTSSPVVNTPGETSQQSTTGTTTNPDGSTTTTTTTTTTTVGADGKATTGKETIVKTCDAPGNCTTSTNSSGAGRPGNGGMGGEDSCPEGSDRLACLELGSGDGGPGGGGDQVGTESHAVAINADGGWGAGGGGCPADKTVTLHNGTVLTFPFTFLCTAADYCRPVVIAMAWLSAVLLFVRISSGGGG